MPFRRVFGWLIVCSIALLSPGCGEQKDKSKREGPKAPPVVVGRATRGNFDVYLDALGSVNALNTVTLKSRVDGEVMAVKYGEGQLVKKGDLLIEIDPRQYQASLQQAQGQLARDEASLQNAQADVNRYSAARETVSQQQIDTANAALAQAQAAIKVDQAAIAAAQLQLDYCRITSPIDGKIGLRAIDVGNVVRAGDATGLATITQLQPIAVVFNLPEVNLPSVMDAMRGPDKLTADIFDASRTRKLASGKLEAVDNQIDATTATVRIKAVFDNADGMLFPNQFVNVRLLIKTLRDVVLVPAGAIQSSPDSMFVYVVTKDSKVELRKIKVGPAEGERTVVESGLSENETVVVDGLDKLTPGMGVKVHDPSKESTTRPARSTEAAAQS
jgi:multidrug efflux system membrane fusion protein